MPLFVSTTYFGDRSRVLEAVEKLEEIGVGNIELGSNHTGNSPNELMQIVKSRSRINFIAHNYFADSDPNFVLNVASQNTKIREKSIQFIKDSVNLCQKLAIKNYTIHPGFLTDSKVVKNRGEIRNFDLQFKKRKSFKLRSQIINEAIRIIEFLYKFARIRNVQLLVENEGSKTSHEFVIFSRPKELDLLKKVIGKNFLFNFNLAHASLAGIDLKDSRTFLHFYKNSLFFEASEIQDVLDSHLPVSSEGKIYFLIKKYRSYFSKKNVILEYRNTSIKEVKKSYDLVEEILNSATPPVE